MQRRIYLDQAATSWPKSSAGIEAANEYLHQCGATSGRGTYASAQQAEVWVQRARKNVARLVGAADPNEVAFCSSGTHALNAAIFGWLRPGDHVVTTAIEHNSVLRPLHQLEKVHGVTTSIVPCDSSGKVDTLSAANLLSPSTRMLVVGHASNVTGSVQDLAMWRELAERANCLLVLDASQTLGYLPINMQQLGIDVLVAAGHKGLRALPGSGLLVARQALHASIQPLMFGGTGIASELLETENHWPHSIEVGNLNLPAVISMAVASQELLQKSHEEWSAWQQPLTDFVKATRERIPGLRLIGHDADGQVASGAWLPVISLLPSDWDIHEAAAVLDANFGIEVRAGYHCAALVHEFIGSKSKGGTLRLSLGTHTSPVDLEDTLHALASMFGST